MTFEQFMKSKNPEYTNSDDSIHVRTLREVWQAATLAERDACAEICEQQAVVNTVNGGEAYNTGRG